MSRVLRYAVCVWLMPSVLWAFEARVVDGDGAAVAGADVSVLGHHGSARTDDHGRFRWFPDPPVPFEVLVILPGGAYAVPVFVEELPRDRELTLRVLPTVSETVNVVGGAAPMIDTAPATASASLAREEIATRHPARLADVLENIPGAGRVSDLHAGVPSLRGLARGRTLVLIDGARVTTERRFGANAAFLDPFFLEGVEVARGPGAVAYGSDAFGGVIHARTRQVRPGSPTSIRFRGALGAGLPETTTGIELARGLDRGGLLVQARHRHFDGYSSPDGAVPNSQATDQGVVARMSHQVGRGEFTAGWQTSQVRDMGRPDNRGGLARTTHPKEDSHRLTLSYDASPVAGFNRLGVQGFWGQSSVLTDQLTAPTRRAPETLRRSDVSARDFSVRSFAARPVGPARWELGLDINGRYGLRTLNSVETGAPLFDDSVAVFDEVAIDSAHRLDVGLYTSTDLLLTSRVTVGAALRFDRVTTANVGGVFGDRTTSNSAFSGYGSVTVALAPGLSVTTQLARGFRDPTLSDRYFLGLGGRGVVTGNPLLAPETANQLDTALRFVRGRIRWAAYSYYYRVSRLIERFEPTLDMFSFRNRGQADFKGAEFELQAQLPLALTLDVSAAVVSGRTREDGASTDDIPARAVTLVVRRAIRERGYLLGRVAHYFDDGDPGPTEVALPGYALVDLGVGWRFSERIELRGITRNLLDRAYAISPDPRAVLAPGRNGVVTIVVGL